MAQINKKIVVIQQALDTCNESIAFYHEFQQKIQQELNERNSGLYKLARDSMIQRFEYCADLFWKVLKVYLEEIAKFQLEEKSPRGVIRAAVLADVLSEEEGEVCLVMIQKRNETSHIYHQETAQAIAEKVPTFYQVMVDITDRIAEKSSK